MSSAEGLNYVPEWDPINISARSEIQVPMGVKSVQHKVAISGSSSPNNIDFTVNASDGEVLVPSINITLPIDLDINFRSKATAALCVFASPNNWCFSNQAAYRMMDKVNVTIGGHTVERRTAELMNALAPLFEADDVALSSAFTCLDNVTTFLGGAGGDGDLAPFGNLARNINARATPRRLHDDVVTIYNATTNVAVAPLDNLAANTDYRVNIKSMWSVPIPLDLFNYAGGSPGLSNVRQCNFNISLSSAWERAIKINNLDGMVIQSISMTKFTQPPSLNYSMALLHDSVRTAALPQPQFYPMTNYFSRREGLVHLDGGAKMGVVTNAVMASSVPSKIIIAARRVNVTSPVPPANPLGVSISTPDFYGRIENLTISFGGQNLLQISGAKELWSLSVKNGLKQTWQAWSSSGGPVILSLEDCQVGCGELFVGARTSSDFSTQFTLSNPGASAQAFEPVVILTTTEILRVGPAGDVAIISAVSVDEEGKRSLFTSLGNIAAANPRRIGAGAIGNFFKSIGKGIVDYGPKVLSAIGQGANLVKTLRGGGERGGFLPQHNVSGGGVHGGCGEIGKPRRGAGIDDAPGRVL